jgi:hypothetical protein
MLLLAVKGNSQIEWRVIVEYVAKHVRRIEAERFAVVSEKEVMVLRRGAHKLRKSSHLSH